MRYNNPVLIDKEEPSSPRFLFRQSGSHFKKSEHKIWSNIYSDQFDYQAEICSAFICWLFRNQVSSMWLVEGPDWQIFVQGPDWQIFVQGPNWQIFVQGRNRGDLGLNSATTRMGGRWWEETSFVRIWVKYQSRESVQSKYSKIAQFVEFIDPFYPKYYLKYEIWAIDKQIVRLFL